MPTTALRVAARPREFVAVRGPDAASYLQAMVSNDVEGLAVGEACEALLLTSKARVIAPLVVLRRAEDDFLLLTEPGLGERVQRTLVRSRFAKQCEIEPEEHTSTVVLGDAHGIPTVDYGVPAVEVLDAEKLEPTMGAEELELLRIRAGTPRFGREIDDRVLPAEAGLEERAIDFEKGCYPGQEPIARQHYRGRVNRTLRALALEGDELPAYDAQLEHAGKVVGRVTSAVRDPEGGVVALGYVRVEVPDDAALDLGGRSARPLDFGSPRP
jgi:tRNA-modifying protein YgfZ